jgi:hypothetical protein
LLLFTFRYSVPIYPSHPYITKVCCSLDILNKILNFVHSSIIDLRAFSKVHYAFRTLRTLFRHPSAIIQHLTTQHGSLVMSNVAGRQSIHLFVLFAWYPTLLDNKSKFCLHRKRFEIINTRSNRVEKHLVDRIVCNKKSRQGTLS